MPEEFMTITGVTEACALLDAAPAVIVRRTFTKALTAASVPVVQAVNYNVPELTGELADHLVTDVAIRGDGSGGTVQIGFGNWGWIARLVELGHRAIGHKPDKKQLAIGRVKPHPFMRPSAEQAKEDAVEAFAESVQQSLGTMPLEDLKAA